MGRKLTNEEFLQKLKDLGRDDLIPLEEYKGSHVKIKWKCTNVSCNNEWETVPYHIYNGEGCPKCSDIKRRENKKLNTIRSFAEENPDLIKYFKDKEIAYKYSPWSIESAVLVCPQCGSEKICKLANLNHRRFSCNICDDSISFPNRLVREILKAKNIPFETEWNNNNEFVYKYDIKLEQNGKIILLELDGEYHIKDEETKKRDKEKNKIANKKGWELIRVDVIGSESLVIYKNLLDSNFSKYWDVSDINLLECERLAQKSITPKIWEYYNNNLNLTYKEIAKHFNVSSTTVSRKLETGRKVGKVKNYRKNSSKGIFVYKNNNQIKYYNSATECAEKSFEDFGVLLKRDGIYRAIRENKQYKGYIFKYVSQE